MKSQKFCPDCGNKMHFREYPGDSGGRGIWECWVCDDDIDDLSNTHYCPDCGDELDYAGYCYYCDMTRQAHDALYPDDELGEA